MRGNLDVKLFSNDSMNIFKRIDGGWHINHRPKPGDMEGLTPNLFRSGRVINTSNPEPSEFGES
jgi:hypothetical protein